MTEVKDFDGTKFDIPHALLTATSAFVLRSRCLSSPQKCALPVLSPYHTIYHVVSLQYYNISVHIINITSKLLLGNGGDFCTVEN